MSNRQKRAHQDVARLPRAIALSAEHDPDPVHPDHFMFVLGWQAANPNHRLARLETYDLARRVRAKARAVILEAEEEYLLETLPIEEDAYYTEQHAKLMELLV